MPRERPPPKFISKRGAKAVVKALANDEPVPISETMLKKIRARKSRIDWENCREYWINSHLQGKGVTLEAAGLKFGAAAPTVFNKSAVEKWSADLAFKMTNRDNIVAEALKERSTQAIVELNKDFIAQETEVRRRHALMAKGLQGKAMRRLTSIPVDELKPMEAIAMLKLGLDEERRALGLAETYEKSPEDLEQDALSSEYRPLTAQMVDHKKTQQMGIELLRRLQRNQGGAPVQDATILKEVGLER